MGSTTTTTGLFKKTPGRGFTLVEMMISLAVGSLLLAGAMSSIISLTQGSNSLMNYVDMNEESRRTLELFGRDVRGATDVTTMSDSEVVLTTTGPSKSEITVQYLYEADADTLYRNILSGGSVVASQVLLNNVDDLEIRYYTLRLNTASVPLEIKHIQVEAIMKQSSLKVDNTNHIISAQFMLRNKPVSGT